MINFLGLNWWWIVIILAFVWNEAGIRKEDRQHRKERERGMHHDKD